MSAPAARPTAAAPARRGDLLALFGVLAALTLGLGGWLTSLGFGPWYDELAKPSFQPPAWVFAPAWTTIFVLLTVATWQVARRGGAGARAALRLYALQLLLNLLWSLAFFTLHRPDWALADIVLLDVVLLAMLPAYARVHRPAAWLLLPYVVWLGLASAINAWIVLHA